MASVDLKNVGKAFGTKTIIENLNLDIKNREFVVLVGASGCGKSTILRMISGLEPTSSGQILFDQHEVTRLGPKERGIAMVFQNYALYPHMTVFKNMAFSLELAHTPKEEIKKRVTEAAEILKITEHLQKKPSQLSGGQKQRVAIGRAMVRRPKVFLFDEPLSNLDALLRIKMRTEIAELHRTFGSTSVYVTHDQVEAMTLADRIAVMNQGRIEQYGAPLDVYHDPKTLFVASFIGTPTINIFPGSSVSGSPKEATHAAVRPDHITLNAPSTKHTHTLKGFRVRLIEPLGSVAHVHLSNESGVNATCECPLDARPEPGSTQSLSFNAQNILFFNSQGNRIRSA